MLRQSARVVRFGASNVVPDGHHFLDFGASKGGCVDFAVAASERSWARVSKGTSRILPPDQHDYQIDVHPPKPAVRFARPLYPSPVYKEMVCVVRLRDFDGWDDIIRARRGCELLDGTSPKAVPSKRAAWKSWLQRVARIE